MTNQNVQTNRHGPQNKGCNLASADSKHYLVSKLQTDSKHYLVSKLQTFIKRGRLLTTRLLTQEYQRNKLDVIA